MHRLYMYILLKDCFYRNSYRARHKSTVHHMMHAAVGVDLISVSWLPLSK
jgi:hypothetical protein